MWRHGIHKQVGVCEMQRSRSAIVRNCERDYTSLIIDPQADHKTVVSKAAHLLHLNPEKCSLFHLNGCKITDREMEDGDGIHPWCIGRYLRSIYAKNSAYKIGLLCEDESDEVHVYKCSSSTCF